MNTEVGNCIVSAMVHCSFHFVVLWYWILLLISFLFSVLCCLPFIEEFSILIGYFVILFLFYNFFIVGKERKNKKHTYGSGCVYSVLVNWLKESVVIDCFSLSVYFFSFFKSEIKKKKKTKNIFQFYWIFCFSFLKLKYFFRIHIVYVVVFVAVNIFSPFFSVYLASKQFHSCHKIYYSTDKQTKWITWSLTYSLMERFLCQSVWIFVCIS